MRLDSKLTPKIKYAWDHGSRKKRRLTKIHARPGAIDYLTATYFWVGDNIVKTYEDQ